MKNLLIILVLTLTPSCAAMDKALGLGSDGTDQTEDTIAAGEGIVRTVGDSILPGAGGAAALAIGLFARAYVKRRKAAQVVA